MSTVDNSATVAEQPSSVTHSEYYHMDENKPRQSLINEEWEPIGYKDTTSISFNESGTLCAFGKLSGAVDIYDIGTLQPKACSLLLKDTHPDGSSYTSYYLAWSGDNISLLAFYSNSSSSGGGGDVAVLWDVRARQPSHVVRLQTRVTSAIFLSGSANTVMICGEGLDILLLQFDTDGSATLRRDIHMDSTENLSSLLSTQQGTAEPTPPPADTSQTVQTKPFQNIVTIPQDENTSLVCLVHKKNTAALTESWLVLSALAVSKRGAENGPPTTDFNVTTLSTVDLPIECPDGDVIDVQLRFIPDPSGDSDGILLYTVLSDVSTGESQSRMNIGICDVKTRQIKWQLSSSDVYASLGCGSDSSICCSDICEVSQVGCDMRIMAGLTTPLGVKLAVLSCRHDSTDSEKPFAVEGELALISRGHYLNKFTQLYSSPTMDIMYIRHFPLQSTGKGNVSSVYLTRPEVVSTFAGVEYPLGYHRVDDSTMYVEKEDEFDVSVLEQEEVAATLRSGSTAKRFKKGSRRAGQKLKHHDMVSESSDDEETPSAAPICYNETNNAMLNSKYFEKSTAKRRKIDDTLAQDMGGKSNRRSCLPCVPSDFVFPSEPTTSSTRNGKKLIRSMGPHPSSKKLLKGWATLADPTAKILRSVKSTKPEKVSSNSECQDCGLNMVGAPPIGNPYLLDGFSHRIAYEAAEGDANLSLKELLFRGIESNYNNTLRGMEHSVMLEQRKHSEIRKRMESVQCDTEKAKDYYETLKRRGEAQQALLAARKAQLQALKKEKAVEAARDKALREEALTSEQTLPALEVLKEEPMEIVADLGRQEQITDTTGSADTTVVTQGVPPTSDQPAHDVPSAAADTVEAPAAA